MEFRIDTGSDVSCIPPPEYKNIAPNPSFELFAANNTKIKTFGTKTINLSFGLRRNLKRDFIIADVSIHIVGADFLAHFGLIVDLKQRKLIDTLTNLSSLGNLERNNQLHIKTVSGNSIYSDIQRIFSPSHYPKRDKTST
ncbi:gag-pol polyprotein [Trichonephila clavata]|uniref:Gag-pol polyprotein n=1 Tax=Trichonephila clavata TaxID=2740835 RepID=A0A8X6L6J7_TRICU|nr:gag-pol polyprotein [Trichonephila clavata]